MRAFLDEYKRLKEIRNLLKVVRNHCAIPDILLKYSQIEVFVSSTSTIFHSQIVFTTLGKLPRSISFNRPYISKRHLFSDARFEVA